MERHNKLSIVIVVLAMLGAVFATAGIAAGDGPVIENRGVLLLYTVDNGSRIDWHAPEGTGYATSPSKTQTINIDSKCDVSLQGDQLVTITATASGVAKGVGAVSHGLGVKTKNNCSTEQGQIALGQSLKIALGSFFGPRVVIGRAEIDVEGKRNAGLMVTYTKLDGTTITEEKTLSLTSDNGPDAGPADNNIVELDLAPARAIKFEPKMNGLNSPAVSIEGGGDGAVVGGTLRGNWGNVPSVFALEQQYSGSLDCGDITPTVGGPTEMQGTFKRLPNLSEACSPKPYTLNVSSDGQTLTFDPDGTQDAAYSGFVSSAEKSSANQNPTTSTLRYDPDLDGTFVTMKWCTSATISPVDGYATSADLPAGETWCIAAENTVIVSSGKIRTTWTVYGHDDPFFRGN